ncbi:SUMF1/EgtB/PvdO family nonheme iron enzyme [Sorangium sp. So ce834]|uniref:formylglycine-generating enzyme family protein n=1 Tax=Sorangium sp. So ce834 TaxID=3133321 RepID=UPI003F603238
MGIYATCGPPPGDSCCATVAVPGGMFNRDNDAAYPATVSGFFLDRFEVTVGRFRKFVEAYPGSRPEAGAGRHPLIETSGWRTDWDNYMPADADALKEASKCYLHTWTDEAGDYEHLPMNCLSWYVAFAFCAWDGGRLPTEAEWNYAAAGGSEQRPYPWSNSPTDESVDSSYAVYDCGEPCMLSDIQTVGSRSPRGDGKWGQADLAGNMVEWALDLYASYPDTCDDCANVDINQSRVIRGGHIYASASYELSSFFRDYHRPSEGRSGNGVRCARTP